MITYNLFEFGEGFGYQIISDGNIIIQQEWDPDEPGLVLMTREIAETKAKRVIFRIEVG